MLAEVDLRAIIAALAVEETDHASRRESADRHECAAKLERQLAEARTRIDQLERDNCSLTDRLAQIVGLASDGGPTGPVSAEPMSEPLGSVVQPSPPPPARATWRAPRPKSDGGGELHPAARKMLTAPAQHAPGRFTWGQVATLAGLKPSGYFNAGRKELREVGYVTEASDLVSASPAGLKAAGEVPPQPLTPERRGWRSGARGFPHRHQKCSGRWPHMARISWMPRSWLRCLARNPLAALEFGHRGTAQQRPDRGERPALSGLRIAPLS